MLLSLILAAFAGLGGTSLVQKSVTTDEFAHLPAGLSFLRTGDFRLYPHNPPLIRMWAALPLLWSQVELPRRGGWKNRDHWLMGYQFMYANAAHYQEIYVRARAMIMALGVLLIVLTWWWARRLYGPASGLGAAGLCAFCPNLMAHSELATTDLGATLFFLAAVYAGWEFCRRPSRLRGIGAGFLLGLALISKFTALLLLPLFLLLGLGYRLAGGKPWSGRIAGPGLALLVLAAWLTVNSGYCWRGFGAPLRNYQFQSQTWSQIASALPPSLPLPLPEDLVRGLDLESQDNETRHEGYLFGRISDQGWFSYYLIALLVKMPIPALLLIAGGLGSLCFARRRSLGDELFVVIPPVLIILVFSAFSHINVGVRYILAAFPFLFILAARLFQAGLIKRTWLRAGLLLLLSGQLLSNLLVYPDYLAYFNFAAGGPSGGYRILADSNLDWGQDLIGLKRYLDQQGIPQICLAYFGRVDPKLYGIQYRLPRPDEPCEAVAVSVNLLLGLSYPVMDGEYIHRSQPGEFSWLQKYQPITTIGHSIWILRPQPPMPAGPPAP